MEIAIIIGIKKICAIINNGPSKLMKEYRKIKEKGKKKVYK